MRYFWAIIIAVQAVTAGAFSLFANSDWLRALQAGVAGFQLAMFVFILVVPDDHIFGDDEDEHEGGQP